MADMQSGVLSTPTLHELNTLMEKRRSELKQLKEGRLKANRLVSRVRNSFSLEDTGTPAAVRTQDGFSTPFYNATGSSGQVSDHHAIESAPIAVQKIIPASSESHISHQNVSDDKQTTSQSLKEAREEIDELRRFSSNQRIELDANESLTALRAKLDEYDEIDHITREADEQMLELCDNLARTKQELETSQKQLTDVSNEVAIKREENLNLSRELHGALRRVEEFEAVRSEEKEEWQDRQKSTTAAENEEEMIEIRKKLALEKQKNRIALAKGVAAAQQGSQHRQYYQPSILRVFLVLVGWVGVLGCTALLVMSGEFSSCSVDIVRLAY